MNLGQAAQIVGMRLGTNTSSASTNDGAAVRAFLTTWHNTLWRAYLWKDSICEFVTTLNNGSGNYLPSKSRMVLPPIIDKVLGVRFNYRALDIQRPMLYYRANYGAFFCAGYAAEYELLSACVWEYDTVQNLALQNANNTDNNQVVTLDELASDEVTVVRNTYPLLNTGVNIMATDRIDNFIKPATQGTVSLGIANPFAATITLNATQTSAPKSQRIQFVGTPSQRQQSETLRILGKRTIPTYVSDSDVPGVAGFTEILIALAYYDFKKRDEQGGSTDATASLVEAVGPNYLTQGIPGGLLKGLIREEVEQAASNTRIVPSHGFGGFEYDYPVESKSDPYGSC